MVKLIAALSQKAAKKVYEDKRSKITNVAVVVDRRSAGIHADAFVFERFQLFHAT